MEDTLDILTRALHWEGDRDILVKLITDIADASYDLEETDAARYAITALLADTRVLPIWRPQLEIYMVTLEKNTAIAAKHLRNAEAHIAKLDEVCHATGLFDKRLANLHMQLADYRKWYEEDCPDEWERADVIDEDWSEKVFRVVYRTEDKPTVESSPRKEPVEVDEKHTELERPEQKSEEIQDRVEAFAWGKRRAVGYVESRDDVDEAHQLGNGVKQ